LPFGKDGVKGQATLARARKTCDYHQFITGNGDIDILQLVLAGTTNNNFILGHTTKPPITTSL